MNAAVLAVLPEQSGPTQAQEARARAKDLAAQRTAEEFEAVFLAQFAQTLFSSVKSDGPFGGGPEEDIYKSLLANEYGKSLARQGGVGIADAVYREILKSQEVT